MNVNSTKMTFNLDMDISKIKPIYAIICYILIFTIIYVKLSNENKTKAVKDQSTTVQIITTSIVQSIVTMATIIIAVLVIQYLKTNKNLSSLFPKSMTLTPSSSTSSTTTLTSSSNIIDPLSSIKASISYYIGIIISIILIICSLLALKFNRMDIFSALLVCGLIGIFMSKQFYKGDMQNSKISIKL